MGETMPKNRVKFFSERGYEIRHRGFLLKGIIKFVIRGFSPKGVIKFVEKNKYNKIGFF